MSDLKCFYEETELPEKFIAIYSDGSGCDIFFNENGEYYPAHDYELKQRGRDYHWFADAGYLWFIPLPDDFSIFGRGE